MKITRHLLTLTLALSLTLVSSAHAGWKVPITVTAGGVTAKAAIGMESGATNGYDAGRDVPVPDDSASSAINAYFAHPEWGVTVAGKPLVDFYQEIKGESYPAEWKLEVDTTLTSSHTMTWIKPDPLPKGLSLYLYPPTGPKIDMLTTNSYTLTPSSSSTFTIQASVSGTTPPLSPAISKVTPQDSSLFVEWTGNDPDTAGYKIHFGTGSGNYERTFDTRDATNRTIIKLTNGTTYYVAVTAYNKTGTESSYSGEAQGVPAAPVQYFTVSGKVIDVNTGQGVSGVSVTLSTNPPTQTVTDAAGNYAFTNLITGNYAITPSRTSRDRFIPSEKNVSITSKDAAGVDFRLKSGGRRR